MIGDTILVSFFLYNFLFIHYLRNISVDGERRLRSPYMCDGTIGLLVVSLFINYLILLLSLCCLVRLEHSTLCFIFCLVSYLYLA